MSDLTALPCIVCGKALKGLDEEINHPSGGTEFTSPGHYGSAVTDTMGRDIWAIDICDPCMRDAIKEGRVGRYEPAPPPRNKYAGVVTE